MGVSYEVSTIGLFLKELDLTLPKPRRRDYRQNPQRVAPWQKEILPELKKTAEPEHRVIFSEGESACYLLPQVRRTWAPVGQTPILTAGRQYAHLSVMTAISEQGDIYSQLQETSDTGSKVAKVIRNLCGLTQPKLLLIGDGASIPRSQQVKDWLRQKNSEGRMQLALLPAYSPHLNAAEPV